MRDGWKHPVHVHQWLRSLETYAYPIIGKLPIDAITTDHVMQVLQPIWATKADTASKVRQRIERVLIWAKARKLRTGENPAAWKENIEPLVMPVAAAKQNIRDRDGDDKNYLSLPYSDIPEFMRTLHEPRFQNLCSAAALEFLIMTATRRAKAVAVEWEHIDFAKQVWTIPAEQMKSRKGMGVELRVPLCDAVIALLRSQQTKQYNNPSRYVFPGAFDITRPIHGETLWQLLGHMGYRERATVHGFRATFRTWGAEETDAPFDVLERALAHTTGNAVVNAYDRGDRFERRRQVMNAWARFALGEELPQVIEFPRRSG
jgi:integrase